MDVNGSATVNFTELRLQLCILQTHVPADRQTDRQIQCSAFINPNGVAKWQIPKLTRGPQFVISVLPGAYIWQLLDGLLVDLPSVSDAKDVGSSLEVHTEHVQLLLRRNGLSGTVVDSHCMSGQAMLLLQLGVEQVQSWGRGGAGQRVG